MKKAVSMICAIIMCFTMLAGCAKGNDTGAADNATDAKKVAVLIPGSVAYFTATRAGSDEAAEKYGLELSYYDANWDVATQLSQIEDAITGDFDMIALCASDAEGILPGIEAAVEAGVPIMTFTNAIGSDASGTVDGVVTYVGQNEVETGKLCAQIAQKLLGEQGGKVVMIEGQAGTFCQVYRQKGFLEGIEGTNLEVVFTKVADWDKEKAMSITEDLISSNTDFDLIFCQDDGMAAGAGQALVDANLKDKVRVVGLGGSIDGMKAMKAGLIDGNTFMSAKEEGFMAIEACYKYLNGEELEPRTILTQVEVNMDNIDEFTPEW